MATFEGMNPLDESVCMPKSRPSTPPFEVTGVRALAQYECNEITQATTVPSNVLGRWGHYARDNISSWASRDNGIDGMPIFSEVDNYYHYLQ